MLPLLQTLASLMTVCFLLLQWEVKKEAALSRIVEQRMNKEAVEAENAANNAKLAEHLVHVSPFSSAMLKMSFEGVRSSRDLLSLT